MAVQYGKGATARMEPLKMLQTGRGTREIKEEEGREQNRSRENNNSQAAMGRMIKPTY
jgi:hypothetical protein